MKALFALLAIAGFTSTAAADYYEFLKNKFENTREADREKIALSDFRHYGHPKAHYCVEYAQDNPLQDLSVKIGLFTHYADGPGPDLPPLEITKVFLTYSEYEDLSYVFHTSKLETKAKEIKVSQTNPEKFDLWIRKINDHPYFKRTRMWTETQHDEATDKDVTVNKSEDRYGYCFQP